jgi:hypothetical protein
MQKSPAIILLPSGENGGSFVTVSFGNRRVTAVFAPAKTALILALNRELLADADLEPLAQGWRSPAQISNLLDYPLEESSLRRSISLINQAFAQAAAQLEPPLNVPALITSKRGVGIRLTWRLDIMRPKDPPAG